MASNINEVLNKTVEQIHKNNEVYGIILVGSNANKKRDEIRKCSDIDLFVILKQGNFERQVDYFKGIEFDISYIGLSQIEDSINEKVGSIVSIVAKSEKLFGDQVIDNLIKEAITTYEAGPDRLTQNDVDYRRFRITDKYGQLIKLLEKYEFELLLHELVKDVLIFHYELNGKWIPPTKRLLQFIEDSNILDIVAKLSEIKDRKRKVYTVEKLMDTVFGEVGGKLEIWKKAPYPFDFEK